MKLVILSTVHDVGGSRGVVYKFFLDRLISFREKHNVEMLVVGSEGPVSRNSTEASGVLYLEYPNKPVSNKWAAGLKVVKEMNPDYVLVLDSDDLLCDRLLGLYWGAMKTGKYDNIGVTDSYFMALNNLDYNMRCGYWGGYTGKNGKMLGCSKIYSRRVLEKANWDIWGPGRDRLLTAGSDLIMRGLGAPVHKKKFCVQEESVLHIDIKTEKNITSMNKLRRKMVPVDARALLTDHLSPAECEAILDCFNGKI